MDTPRLVSATVAALTDREATPPSRQRLTRPPDGVAASSWASKADPGILFGTQPAAQATQSQPAGTAHDARLELERAAAYAQARHWPAVRAGETPAGDYRAAARQIVQMQNVLDGQDEAGHVGPIFVRFVERHVPDVASARADACWALGRQATHLFAALTSASGREAFVAANGAELLPDFVDHAATVYARAHREAHGLCTGLAGWATAVLRDPHLQQDPRFAGQEPQDAQLRRLLAEHRSALAWPHAASVGGTLADAFVAEPVLRNWFAWRQAKVCAIEQLLPPDMARPPAVVGGSPAQAEGPAAQQAQPAAAPVGKDAC